MMMRLVFIQKVHVCSFLLFYGLGSVDDDAKLKMHSVVITVMHGLCFGFFPKDIDWVQTEKHVFEQASNHPFLVGLHSCFQTASRYM